MVENSNKKYRRFFAQLSYDYYIHDDKGNIKKGMEDMTAEKWKKMVGDQIANLETAKGVKPASYAFVFHDKDTLEDGSPKPLHCHIILDWTHPMSINSVMSMLGVSRTGNIKPVRNLASTMRYLTHVTDQAINAGKHTYLESEVQIGGEWAAIDNGDNELPYHTLKQSKRNGKKSQADDENQEIKQHYIDLALQGRLVLTNLNERIAVEYFGGDISQAGQITLDKEFDRNIKAAFKQGLELRMDHINKGEDRDFKTFYIHGAGGTGKSGLASKLAIAMDPDHNAPHKFPARVSNSVTYDPIGTYGGQYASVANDFAPGSIGTMNSFYGLLDPHQQEPASSRNSDVYWLAHRFIMTHADEPNDWFGKQLLYSAGGSTRAKYNIDTDDDGELDAVTSRREMKIDWRCKNTLIEIPQMMRRIPYIIDLHAKGHTTYSTCWVLDLKHWIYVRAGDTQCSDVTNGESLSEWANEILAQVKVTEIKLEEANKDSSLNTYRKYFGAKNKTQVLFDFSPALLFLNRELHLDESKSKKVEPKIVDPDDFGLAINSQILNDLDDEMNPILDDPFEDFESKVV